MRRWMSRGRGHARFLSKILLAGLLLALAACVSSRPAVQEVMAQPGAVRVALSPGAADGLVPLDGQSATASHAAPERTRPPPIAEQEQLGTRWGEEIRSPIRFVKLAPLLAGPAGGAGDDPL